MSVRDLLTFNLFLQLTDGLVSYQAFALGAAEANPVVAAAIINWGMIWGLVYNKALACLLLLLIFALRRSRRLLAMRGRLRKDDGAVSIYDDSSLNVQIDCAP